MKKIIKSIIQSRLGVTMFRTNWLPRGTYLFHDINRWYGIKNFRVVFDVGANIGQSAVRYARCFPSAKIYSFEPVLSTFEELKRNTEHLSNRVRPVQLALGSAKGEKEIYINSAKIAVYNVFC